MYIYVDAYTYTVYTYIYRYVYIDMYTYIYTYTCICPYTYAHMYVFGGAQVFKFSSFRLAGYGGVQEALLSWSLLQSYVRCLNFEHKARRTTMDIGFYVGNKVWPQCREHVLA